jgi:hypothetical protein
MGSTNNELLTIRLTADNVDDLYVSDFIISDTITSGATGKASFTNLTLWVDGEQIGGPLSMVMDGAASSSVSFYLPGDGVYVPKNGSEEVTLRGDVATFSNGGAVSGSTHVFKVTTSDDIGAGTGVNGDTTVTVSGTPFSGNAIKVYRTKLGVTATTQTGTRSRTATDEVGSVTFSADAAYQATLTSFILRFSGLAVSNGSTAFTVQVIDKNGENLAGTSAQTCTPGAGNSCFVTFSPAYIISAGQSETLKVRINSSSFYDAASTNEALSVSILNASDVAWSDGTTSGINLQASQAPVSIANLTY